MYHLLKLNIKSKIFEPFSKLITVRSGQRILEHNLSEAREQIFIIYLKLNMI